MGICSRNATSLVALAFLLACGAGADRRLSASLVRASCAATPYPGLCISSLSSRPIAERASPRQLACAALSVSLGGAKRARSVVANLSAGQEMKGREAGAVKDCIKTVSDSIDQLRRSMREMGQLGGPDFEFHIANVRTWVSAALTDDDTCMDGFTDRAAGGDTRATVRRAVLRVARLTSNALSLISNLDAHSAHG